jgi:sec-independent protein translocase protein TatA
MGPVELTIILLIVVVLFGVGRLSRIGGELGQAISNFRRGLNSGEEAAAEATEEAEESVS